MSVSGIGGRSQLAAQSLVEMRRQLDDLQRQLGSGKKSTTYAGLGLDRGLSVALRSQLAGLTGFDQTMTTVGVRLDLAQNALTRMADIGSGVKSALLQNGALTASGQTLTQTNARTQLDELVDLLNSQIGDRYLFSGRTVDQPPVASMSSILDGDGTRAGLKQVIDERRQADLGASGLGRLTLGTAGSTVTIGEDVAGSPFGFKLAGVTSTLGGGASVSGPAGSPPSIDVAIGASNPQPGESVNVSLTLPDGSTQTLTLTATMSAPPGANQFSIGANPTATAANLQAALNDGLEGLAGTSLTAASAVAAGNDFFSLDAANVPQRVAGPPFDSATAFVNGTAANTVFWYTGEISGDPARSSVTARVDPTLSVNYGMRANEQGFRSLVQAVATFAATSFSPTDPSAAGGYAALAQRLTPMLDGSGGTQKVQDIAAEIAFAQSTMKTAQDRHKETGGMLQGMLDQIEGVSTEEVATQMLTLQTRLQASLQTTAILYRLNLADYI